MIPSISKYLFVSLLLLSCHQPSKPVTKDANALVAQPAAWQELLSPKPYLAQLNVEQQKEYEYLTNELLCPCGDHTQVFAACIEASSCPEALQAASTAARLLKGGVDRSITEAMIVDSFGGPPYEIPLEGSPMLGDAAAPITLVDFADFQCPYCAKLSVALHEVVSSRKDVRLVYKYFPIEMHPFAYLSAEAAAFAFSKGKFWEMHDLLFSRQREMSRENILSWATEIGLDSSALEASWGEAVFAAQVKRDEAQGDKIGVQGTPTLYINGRPYNEAMTAKDINRAIDEALYASKANTTK